MRENGETATPYLTSQPSGDGRPMLLCFHHAGGGASAFAGLRRALAGRVEVLAVQLPGREGRSGEVPPQNWGELVADLDRALDPHVRGEHAYYGHSMGALLAHDLLARRLARGAPAPTRLLVGACRAPGLVAAFSAAHAASDQELTRTMLRIGGMSAQVLSRPAWLRSALALLRSDLRLCASRDPSATGPLDHAVEVLLGDADPLVSEQQAMGWGGRTHRLNGGHFFFLRESPDAFAATVADLVAGSAAHANLPL